MGRVLVLNAGSSSLKWIVLESSTEALVDQGATSWSGREGGRHESEIRAVLARVRSVAAVGHRVVHGGTQYRAAVLVDDAVRAGIQQLSELAPLHNPAALAGINAASEVFPSVPQVAAFDTAFHATLPDDAATYALPWDWTARWGLRRFGFHGLSVQYAVRRTSELLGHRAARLLVCHLGAGCSITAVADGHSVDTSMGFTPLEGLMMAQRAGSIDPGLLLYLLGPGRMTPSDLERGLNEQAGWLGVSGVSDDMRAVLAAADTGNQRARLAVDVFVHRAARVAGGLLASLRGLDALVFTGGIGEHSAPIRARIAERLKHVGVAVDDFANAEAQGDANISAGALVQTLVVTAREDLAILSEVRRLVPQS
jgi:acetate kinase